MKQDDPDFCKYSGPSMIGTELQYRKKDRQNYFDGLDERRKAILRNMELNVIQKDQIATPGK